MQASAADLTAREMSHSLLHSVSMSATSPFHKKGPIARVPTLTSVPSFDGEVVVLPELDTNRRPAATAHSLARDGAPGRVGRVSPPETARARDGRRRHRGGYARDDRLLDFIHSIRTRHPPRI